MKLLKIAVLAYFLVLGPSATVMADAMALPPAEAAQELQNTDTQQPVDNTATSVNVDEVLQKGAELRDEALDVADTAKEKATENVWEPLTGGIEKTIQDPETVTWVAKNAHSIAVVIGSIVVILSIIIIWKVLPVVFRMFWRTVVYAYDEFNSLLFFKSTTRKSKGFLPIGTILTFNKFTAIHIGDGNYKASNGDVYHIDSLATALAAGGKVKIRGGFPVGGTLKIPLGEKGKLHTFEITRRGLLTKYYGNTNLITLPMLRDLGLIYIQEAADKQAAIQQAEEEVAAAAAAAEAAAQEEHDDNLEETESTGKKSRWRIFG